MLFTFDNFWGVMNSALQIMPFWIRPVDREISWEDAYLKLNSDLRAKRSGVGVPGTGSGGGHTDEDGRDTRDDATRLSSGRTDPHFQSREQKEQERLQRGLRTVSLAMGAVVAFLLLALSLLTLWRSAAVTSEAQALSKSLTQGT